MIITLREIEYFVAIAEQGHFGRASQVVSVSQPTLSMQFKKLEERLGGKLIERLPREAILTALGQEVLPMARQILNTAAEIERVCGARESSGRLRFGVIPTLSPYLLPKINKGLAKMTAGRKISLSEAQTSELIRLVKDGSIDVAIVSTPLNEKGVEEIEVFSEPFFLAVSKSHPLAKRRRVSLEQMKHERLLLLEEGHCLRNQALSVCDVSHARGDTDLSATSIETLRSMVAMGAGVTLIPKLAIRPGEGVAYIPFAERSASRTVGIIYRPSFTDKAIIELLVGVLRSVASRDHMPLVEPQATTEA